MILIGNHNTDQRISFNRIFNLKNSRKRTGALHLHLHTVIIPHMVMNRTLRRIDCIGFGADVRRHRVRMRTPIIKNLRNMLHIPRLLRQTQNHIMILASVVFRTEQSGFIQKLCVKYREMTDVIIGPQIIRGIVRLKMKDNQIIQVRRRKCGFIRIDIIRALFADHLHTFKKQAWMHHIIMVKKPDIISVRHGKAHIGVSGDSQVLLKLFIDDPAVLLPVLPAYPSYIRMLVITSVRQAELPVFVGLSPHRIDHLPKEFFRRVIKGHKNTDFNVSGKYGLLLCFPSRLVRKTLCSEIHPFRGFPPLLFPASVHTSEASVMNIGIPYTQKEMDNNPKRLACFPVPGIPHPVKTFISVCRQLCLPMFFAHDLIPLSYHRERGFFRLPVSSGISLSVFSGAERVCSGKAVPLPAPDSEGSCTHTRYPGRAFPQ